jgi:hypothetical protein
MSLIPSQNPVWTIQADQRPSGQKDRILSWKHVYTVCRWILRGTQWVGTAVILVIFVSLAASLLAGQSNQANSTLIASLLGKIQQQQLLTLVILGLLLFLIAIAWVLILLTPKKDREPSKEEEAKKREEALLRAENDLLVTEQSALKTEERKAALLEQLLEIEREQTTLLKQLTLGLK